MTNAQKPSDPHTLEGIEVVELWEVDLDFAVEEAFREGAARTVETTRTEAATPQELGGLDLFQGLGGDELAAFAPQCQSIHAVPGYVVLAPGRLNTKIFFVLEGQLRLYPQTGDKRPQAVVDVGQSTGLRSALLAQPLNHSVIATEVSHVLAIDVATIDECAKRFHGFARNYAALLAAYIRGDNCLYVNARSTSAAKRQGYIDELTLLHNQHWLDTVLPRLLTRFRMGDKTLAIVGFAVDKLEQIVKEHGVAGGMRVLETVGRWVLDQTRPTDLLAINQNRHIFAFLPDCDLTAARNLAGRLKSQIANLPISLGSNKTPAPITVTLAIGIVQFESGMKDNELVSKTETLIQKSIKLGGNWLSESLETATP